MGSGFETLKNWLLEKKAIDKSVTQAEEIRRLDLSGCAIEVLPTSIGLLKNLVVLNISGNHLKTLPETLANLTHLNNLDLRRNRFEDIPQVITSLHIKSLNLSSNKIVDITPIGQCQDLRVLDVSFNAIKSIDNVFKIDNALRTLNLSGNFIEDISGACSTLSQVERLNLSQNVLSHISSSYGALDAIVELNLSDNRIETVAPEFYTLLVEDVDLSANQLKTLTLEGLEDLEQLVLDENPLKKIEVKEGFAPYLQEFSCDSCQLKTFVPLASKELRSLCLSSNSISKIPESIGNYTKLVQLDIDNNKIIDVPNALSNMTLLQTLYIGENPLSDASQKIIKVLHPDICDINMKTGISIERAGEENLEEMATLLSKLFAIEKDFEIDFDKQLSGITKLFTYEGADLLVAKHEGKVVGMVTMQRLISSAAGDFVGQIEDLIVDEAYRKMGVGSRLINKMRFIAIETYGYQRIQLGADMDNINALNFYTRRGFRRTNLNVFHLEK